MITAEAYQRGLEDELKNARRPHRRSSPRIDLAKKRVEQFTALAATGAGRRAEQEQAESDVGESRKPDPSRPNATESKIKQKIEARTAAGEIDEVAQAKAQIAKAEADLVGREIRPRRHDAPRAGQRARGESRAASRRARDAVRRRMPVMSFIEEDDPWVLAFFHQNELRYVEPGNEAEIFLETYPGRIIKCKVDSILWATAQGQMPISGNLPNHQPGCRARAAHRGAAARRAEGQGALPRRRRARARARSTPSKGKIIHIIRKVFVRVSTKIDWFVFKLH